MRKLYSIQLSEYFPEVQEFSHSKTNSAKPFIPSFEDKTWTSILYIERGNFRIRYETGEILHAKGGTFYCHPPLTLKYQTCDKTITPYSMYHLAMDFSLSNGSILPSHPDGQEIVKQLSAKPFVRNASDLMVSSFKKIIEEDKEQQSGYLFQIENSIRQILISAIRSRLEQETRSVWSKRFVEKVDCFLAENKNFTGPVDLLFEEMGVSRSRGYDIFHMTFGINPKEYILRKKIIIAKQMLMEERDIASIAYDLGFSSSQSFATSFKKLTCSTPTNYRKNNGYPKV
jgi:AraC-like DNA-binding protein